MQLRPARELARAGTPGAAAGEGASALGPAAPPAARGGQYEKLIVDVVVNGVPKGELFVVSTSDGDYLVREEDFATLGSQPPRGQPIEVEGERFHSLRAMQARVRFDEAKLVLALELAPEQLPRRVLDLMPGRPQRVVEPRDASAFLNYRVLKFGSNSGADAQVLSAGTELGVRIGDFLFRSDSSHVRSSLLRQDLRYATSLTHDNRRTLQRWVIGDFTASSGELGNSLDLGGISFSRSFDIDPYFLRQPLAGFTAPVTLPARAEISIDGVRVRTESVLPGQFELRNLNSYGGRRDVTIVLRDQFGRVQSLQYPFYFTEQNLRQGVHEYSYNAGFQRLQLGVLSNQYGAPALSAFHRYGLSDALTVGGRGEAEPGRFNLGPVGVLRSDRLGVLSGGVSYSGSSEGAGWAGLLGHAYQSGRFNSQLSLRRHTPRYETIGQFPLADRLRNDLNATLGYTLEDLGGVSIGYRSLRQYRGLEQRSRTISYSKSLFGSLSLLVSLERLSGTAASTNLNVIISYSPDRDLNVGFFHERRAGGGGTSLQIANSTPVGTGWGYRLGASRSQSGEGLRLAPAVQYNGPHGIYSAEAQTERLPGTGSRDSYQLGVGGGIAYVAGALAFTRPVTDSFGIVEVGRLPGVRVYHSAQEIGRTDDQGRVFLPNLGSYQANRVAIDDRDIPIEFTIGEKELNISPPLRSGSLIRFEVHRTQAVTGRLQVTVGETARPAEYLDLKVRLAGRIQTFPTGEGGEFYLDDVAPGRYEASFDDGGRRCEFVLTVPESQTMLVDLGVLNVCKFPR